MKNEITILVAFAVIALIAAMPLATALSTINAPRMRKGDNTSYNWGGYVVTGSGVTDVKGSWVVPAASCNSTANQYTSMWVGIDGYNSNTVEQIGTDSDCLNGVPTYYVWFEFYPKGVSQYNGINLKPGDVVSAEVKYLGSNQFGVYITDLTTSQSFNWTAVVKNAKRNSAEWIVEAPYGGGVVPLSNFGTAYLGYDNTGVSATNYATVNGKTGPIGSFGSAVKKITMVDKSGAVKVQVSPLSADGTSFSAQWIKSA